MNGWMDGVRPRNWERIDWAERRDGRDRGTEGKKEKLFRRTPEEKGKKKDPNSERGWRSKSTRRRKGMAR